MKKLLLAFAILIAVTGCENGGITTPTTNDLVAPDYNYEIDTWGSNSEVYEITPKSNTDKTCIYVILDSGKATSMQCFDRKKIVFKNTYSKEEV